MINAAIVTMSDKGSRGEREDTSSEEIKKLLATIPANLAEYVMIPDDKELIKSTLIDLSDNKGVDLIVTTGGTGVGERDVTPEATLEVIDRAVPGMAEAMRSESLKKTPHAMLSRAVVGMRAATLIINLPGSPKAVRENFAVVIPAIQHAVEKIKGDTSDCASPWH
ncbi:molybdenum cofactor biosynthesis protein B [Thermodesulfobacteriota bacterium]